MMAKQPPDPCSPSWTAPHLDWPAMWLSRRGAGAMSPVTELTYSGLGPEQGREGHSWLAALMARSPKEEWTTELQVW